MKNTFLGSFLHPVLEHFFMYENNIVPSGAKVLDVFAPPREEYRQAGSGFATAEA